jgi:hypothetical protein
MSSDIESIERGDHVAKIRVWLKSPSDTLYCKMDLRLAHRDGCDRNRYRQNPGPIRSDLGLARYRIRVGSGNSVRIS